MILKYLLYFILGAVEQFFSIAYYKTGQRNYDLACAILDLFRGAIWLFVVSSLINNLHQNVQFGIAYIIGCSVGDYISLKLESFVDKKIQLFRNRGRRKKRWYLQYEDKK